MTPERLQTIEEIFHSALECAPASRSDYLDRTCADDEPLRREVEVLLASHDHAKDFIEQPPAALAAELMEGEQAASVAGVTLGHYKIDERIGTGGMGEVYFASDVRSGRRAALKLLPSRFTRDEERVSRFQQEARAVIALNHPNILTVYEVGEESETYYIASELVEGETLRRRLARGRVKLNEALDVAIQVASALVAAHQSGVVHRDVKPENIMLRPDGYVKVLDFGLAKLAEHEAATASSSKPSSPNFKTDPGMVMGTAHYMSPEQARGREVDERTDVWSLGVVLYEMVTGRQPFVGETPADVIVSVLEREAPRLESHVAATPEPLEDCIRKALAKDRERRYRDAGDVLEDLRRLRKQLDVDAALVEQGQTRPAPGEGELTSAAKTRRLPALVARLPTPAGAARLLTRSRAATYCFLLIAALLIAVPATFLAVRMKDRPKSPAVETAAAAPKTMAVLPFKSLSADEDDAYLGIGLADTLITRLGTLRQIIVRPTSAVRKYATKEQDPLTAGRELQVDAVLDGSIQKLGDKVRVTVRLLMVADGSSLWAAQFDEKMSDIFAVQDSISQRVAAALPVKLTGVERERLNRRDTENPEAYQLYLKGRYLWNQLTDEGLKKAIEHFERAVELDPQYALAYVGLADAHSARVSWSYASPDENFAKAKAAALKALEIDDTLAEAHAVLGTIKVKYEWDWAGAEKAFRRAIELNPNNAAAHGRYGGYLLATGQFDEALTEFRAGQQLDPLSLMLHAQEAVALSAARRPDEAMEKVRKTLEIDPNFLWAHVFLGEIFEKKGMYEEAISEFQKAGVVNGGSLENAARIGAAMRRAYATSGERGYQRWWIGRFAERAKGRPIHNYDRARRYARLGEKDQAFAWLEKAYRHKDPSLASLLKIDGALDSLRTDPRFEDLMRRVGLAP